MLRDRAGGQPPRLGVSDGSADAPADVQADLGQLGGLPRAGFARDDDDLVRSYRLSDIAAARADRQLGIGDPRDRGLPGGNQRFGCCDLLGELLQLLGFRAAKALQSPAEARGVADGETVKAFAEFRDGQFGHFGQDRRGVDAVSRRVWGLWANTMRFSYLRPTSTPLGCSHESRHL